RAVVVDDPPDPAAADLEVVAVGQDRRILAGDVLLVVEAVGYPALDLPAAQPTGVHPDVERVLVVVAPRVGPQRLDEAVGCGRRDRGDLGCRHGVTPRPRGRPWPPPCRCPPRRAARACP